MLIKILIINKTFIRKQRSHFSPRIALVKFLNVYFHFGFGFELKIGNVVLDSGFYEISSCL